MVLLCKPDTAVVEEASSYSIRSAKLCFPAPSVIRLLHYRRVPRPQRSISRKHILIRDGYMCQYCGKSPERGTLTLDHVHPRSRGGQSTWENLVACCQKCNNRKDARTPAEAGMQLQKTPGRFGIHQKHKMLAEPAWEKYLFTS
jgi:5-methylcytosine-specific restriction endonuclease McrA